MSKIDKPGRYDIDIERYHHDPHLCVGPSISASGLKVIAECPARFWAFSALNPNRFPRKETKALDIGRAAHALVLGEPEFAKHFIISPYAEFRTNEAKAWRDAQPLTILKSDEFDTVLAMAQAQRANPVVMQAFEEGDPEVSLIWKDPETGIYCKSRPDWLPHDPHMRFLVDYKSALTIEPRKLSVDAFRYGYHVQAAMQMDGVRIALGVERPLGIAHVVQEKDAPWLADLRMFQPEQIEYGRLIYRRALRRFADCLDSGKWPAYCEDPQYFETPAWVARAMEGEFDVDDEYGGTSSGHSYTAGEYAGAI